MSAPVGARRPNARYTPLDAPGPLPVDMVRAVPSLARDPLSRLEKLVARYGDLVAFPLPRGAALLCNDPDGVSRVLRDNPRNWSKRTVQYAALAAVTGDGLLTTDGEPWRAHRALVRPAFHHAVLEEFAAHAVTAGERLRAAWDAAGSDPLDADAVVMRVMLELVGRTLFSTDLGGTADRLVGAVDEALRVLVRRARSPIPDRVPTPARYRLRRAVRTLDDAVDDLIEARRRVPAEHRPADVLSLLVAAAEDGEVSRAAVRDELITLVIAGYETVASSLTWTLGLLADHPDTQDALAREWHSVLGDRAPTAADLPALRLTRAVVDESLRLYPPAWVISRRAVEDDVVAGVRVPAGTLVIVSPWLLHRRAADWPDPLRFDPARFGTGARSAVPRGHYAPFGLGPRLCLGRDTAIVEAVVVLATLLRGRRVDRPPGVGLPRAEALVTLRPRGGLPLVLRRAD